MPRTQLRTFSIIVVLLFLAFCREAWAKDAVRIASLAPQIRSPLRAGDSVNFEIGVEYDSGSENRALYVSVIRGGHGEHSEVVSRWMQVIQGHQRITVQRLVTIPVTNNISIFVYIVDSKSGPNGERLADDRREFDVVDRTGSRIKAGDDGDSLKIVSSLPAAGARFRSGETVRLDLKVDYELKSSASGRVSWGFISGVGIQAAEYTEPIRKGKGSLVLSREVQIQPSMGNTPSLYVMILADGFARRVATDVVSYSMDVTPQSSVDSQTLRVDVEGKFQDRVKILRIAPVGDLRLKYGTPVDMEFRIDYELTSLEDVELEVQFHDRKSFGSDYRVVHRGTGSFTVTRRIVPSKDSGPELSVNVILAIPPVGSDKLTFSISPD